MFVTLSFAFSLDGSIDDNYTRGSWSYLSKDLEVDHSRFFSVSVGVGRQIVPVTEAVSVDSREADRLCDFPDEVVLTRGRGL